MGSENQTQAARLVGHTPLSAKSSHDTEKYTFHLYDYRPIKELENHSLNKNIKETQVSPSHSLVSVFQALDYLLIINNMILF